MSGGVHREVGKMKVWRATVATVIILLSLTSCCTALAARAARSLMEQGAKSYYKAAVTAAKRVTAGGALKVVKEQALTVANLGAGMSVHSYGVGTAMQKMRCEEEEEISLSTQLAITGLAVGDVAGGVLLPVTEKIVDTMLKKNLLKATMVAAKLDPASPELAIFLNNVEVRESDTGRKAVKKLLVEAKTKAKVAMSSNLDNVLLDKVGNSKLIRKVTKVKKLFKAAKFAKALGPAFDVVNIGMSTYSLVTTAIDCHKKKEQCHVGGLVSASFSIVSGVLGIVSVAVPFLAPLALIFGVAASLVEWLWEPPEKPLPSLNLQEQFYDLTAEKMQNLDAFSRMQLQGVNTFLLESGESVDHYIYVVNQGHLPNWMEENIFEPEVKLSGPVTFGLNGRPDYDSNGIYKEQIVVRGQCTDMSEPFNVRSEADKDESTSGERCYYFQEGNPDLTVNSKYEKVGTNLYVGPDFYGISQSLKQEHSVEATMYDDTTKSKYKGVMVLVPTDRVTYRVLRGEEGEDTYTTPVRTRGLHIDTELRLREQSADTVSDDVVAIGDMLNLGYKVEDGGHMVIVNTGITGRDILIIDGWVKKLEARLGSNHNTLSFRTISRSKQRGRGESEDNSEKQNEIKGIKFNPGSGQVIMLGYDPVTEGNVEHDLGHVHGVGFLGASPFDDEVTLFALQKDTIYLHYHFSVYKFMGKATYIFDVKNHKSRTFDVDETVKFKVLDASKAVSNDPDTPADCVDDDAPLLKIINMDDSATEGDVQQYKGNKVYIYRPHNGQQNRIQYATITFVTKCPVKVSATREDGNIIFQKEKKWMTELDIMFYEGSRRYGHDFSVTPENTEGQNDVMYLSCPKSDRNEDMAVTNVETLVVGDAFFDDCLIGTKDEEVGDGEDITVTRDTDDTMRWTFPGQTDETGSRHIVGQTFKGVTKIVNRYNTEIVKLSEKTTFGLYAAFLEASGKDMVEDSNLGDPVKENLNMCILKGTNLAKLAERKAMKRDSQAAVDDEGPEFDTDEINEVCGREGST